MYDLRFSESLLYVRSPLPVILTLHLLKGMAAGFYNYHRPRGAFYGETPKEALRDKFG